MLVVKKMRVSLSKHDDGHYGIYRVEVDDKCFTEFKVNKDPIGIPPIFLVCRDNHHLENEWLSVLDYRSTYEAADNLASIFAEECTIAITGLNRMVTNYTPSCGDDTVLEPEHIGKKVEPS